MFSGMLAGFLKVAAVALVTGGFAGALLAAACSGDGTEPEPTIATITPESTAAPTVTAAPQPPAATATPQPPAPTATDPSVGCPKRTNNHLNIDKLRLQPGMTGAVVTEIDDREIRIVLQGVEFIISGWASS